MGVFYYNFLMSPFAMIFVTFVERGGETEAMKETTALTLQIIVCGDMFTPNLHAAFR